MDSIPGPALIVQRSPVSAMARYLIQVYSARYHDVTVTYVKIAVALHGFILSLSSDSVDDANDDSKD